MKFDVAFKSNDNVDIPKPFLGSSTIKIESISDVSWKSKIKVSAFDNVLNTFVLLGSFKLDGGKFKFSVDAVNVALSIKFPV